MSKTTTYYRHIVKAQPPIKYNGPVPAYRKPRASVERPLNTYRLYGMDFLKHPWRTTNDYSRIRALARDASTRWPSVATEIVMASERVGDCLPIVKFREGVEYRWKGA